MSAELSILGESPSPAVPVSISSFEDGCLKITAAPRLPLGSPVKILHDDCLWLGEVIECRPDGTAIIKVLHSLNKTMELLRLTDRFVGRIRADDKPTQPQPEPTLS